MSSRSLAEGLAETARALWRLVADRVILPDVEVDIIDMIGGIIELQLHDARVANYRCRGEECRGDVVERITPDEAVAIAAKLLDVAARAMRAARR